MTPHRVGALLLPPISYITTVGVLQIEHTVSERDVLRQMNFPFVVHMMSSFQDDNFVYFVLEYSSGGEFFRHLKVRGRYTTSCQQAAQLS